MSSLELEIYPKHDFLLSSIEKNYNLSKEEIMTFMIDELCHKLEEGHLFKSESFVDDYRACSVSEEVLRRKLMSVTALASKAVSETIALNDSIRRSQ